MAYWVLSYMKLRGLKVSGDSERGDAFAVCAIPYSLEKPTGSGEKRFPFEFDYHIQDERDGTAILHYDFREISKTEFDTFLAFECGPEAKSMCGDDDEHPRLYILA